MCEKTTIIIAVALTTSKPKIRCLFCISEFILPIFVTIKTLILRKSKIYKYLGFTFILSSLFGIITYNLLSNRHKAIIKTTFVHTFGLVDSEWLVEKDSKEYKMLSPTFIIDAIYKSMEGPKSSRYIQLSQNNETLWITGFDIKALDAETNEVISNDFICHMNVDLNDRVNNLFYRLTSLSNGFVNFDFPKGYGFLIKSNDYLFITTEALNHNLNPIFKKVKHLVTVKNEKYNGTQKPLMSKTVYIQLPYNKEDPFKSPLDPASNQCIPVETKNHSYEDGKGDMLSGHWVIPKGKNSYRSSINSQLQLKDSLRLHFSAIHVHPFTTSIALYDKTTQQNIFKSAVSNYTDKIGLIEVEPFSSVEGIWLYENHEYELVLESNNTSAIDQDMMGSMFLFFYDKELDGKLRK